MERHTIALCKANIQPLKRTSNEHVTWRLKGRKQQAEGEWHRKMFGSNSSFHIVLLKRLSVAPTFGDKQLENRSSTKGGRIPSKPQFVAVQAIVLYKSIYHRATAFAELSPEVQSSSLTLQKSPICWESSDSGLNQLHIDAMGTNTANH